MVGTLVIIMAVLILLVAIIDAINESDNPYEDDDGGF